jgi:hypothetical protein
MTKPNYSFEYHFGRAEELLTETTASQEDNLRFVALAQVHATLATAIATENLNLAFRSSLD